MMEPWSSGLSPADLLYSERELNETTDCVQPAIREMRAWLTQSAPHLNAKTDSLNIVRFLRACKYDVEGAKKRIKYFYQLKGSTPQWFSDRVPLLPEVQQLLDIGVFLPLLERDNQGRLVILIRAAAHDPKKHKQDDVFKTAIMVLDWLLEAWEDTSVYGVVPVLDLAGISYSHARQLTIPIIRTAVHSWQDCYPVRVRSLEFVNTPSYVDVVLNVFRSFMRPKLKKRVQVHGYSLESLHKRVPADILPSEYGGTNSDLHSLTTYWKNVVTSNTLWYEKDEKHKATIVK